MAQYEPRREWAAQWLAETKKPYIGDADRSIERDDIKRACRLMYITAFLCMIICTVILITTWEILLFAGF